MNQSSQLYQLQKIDTDLDQANNRVTEINRLLEMDEALKQAKNKVEQAQSNLIKTRHSLKNCEESVSAVRIKINTSESSLYGGKIRNPKELQDLQTEIAALKRRLSVLEDEQLEAMIVLEQSENELSTAQDRLVEITADHTSKQSGLVGERTQLEKNIEKLQSMRNGVVSSILPENLEIYERLRKQKRGLAVCAVDENECSACGSTIRPAERQAARSPLQIAYCSSCGRILYAG
jgi:predicted  nucleic acid-binding Zn-ribbon protein